jgi:predicted nucleic acid-binding protein
MAIGLDSNILCFVLDKDFPEHARVAGMFRKLSPKFSIAINPTVLHDAYQTLVYDREWTREDATARLGLLLQHPFIEFYNDTRYISALAFKLAERHLLSGRDSLMLANYLANHVTEVYTHDPVLLQLGEIEWRGINALMTDPVAEPVR